jgi:hypothetical protein
MRGFLCAAALAALAGCTTSGGSGGEDVKPLTGDRKLDRCLAKLQVVQCEVGTLPTSTPAAPGKAKAALAVGSKEGGSADPHRARVEVFDPGAAALKPPDEEGNLDLAAGGAVVLVGAAGTACVWFLEERRSGGGEDIPIAEEGGTPVSVPTDSAADPNEVTVTAETTQGPVDCTPVAATGEAVAALAPLTAAHAGPVTLTATQGGRVIGQANFTAVTNTIQFVPAVIKSGQTGQLVGRFLPAGRPVAIRIAIDSETAPTLVADGQLSGSAGAWVITFRGDSARFTDVPLLTVVGTDKPIQASADVEALSK